MHRFSQKKLTKERKFFWLDFYQKHVFFSAIIALFRAKITSCGEYAFLQASLRYTWFLIAMIATLLFVLFDF